MITIVAETIETLERRIDELRVAVREAVLAGDRALAQQRRSALKSAERAWEDALDQAAAQAGPAGARVAPQGGRAGMGRRPRPGRPPGRPRGAGRPRRDRRVVRVVRAARRR